MPAYKWNMLLFFAHGFLILVMIKPDGFWLGVAYYGLVWLALFTFEAGKREREAMMDAIGKLQRRKK